MADAPNQDYVNAITLAAASILAARWAAASAPVDRADQIDEAIAIAKELRQRVSDTV